MDRIAEDPAATELDPVNRAIVDYVTLLTLHPARVTASHLDQMREVGLSDAAILDVVQVTGLFNYYNRLADGLGIDPEPDWTEPTCRED